MTPPSLVALIAVAFVAAAIAFAVELRTRRHAGPARQAIAYAGVALFAYGVLGFFGAFLSATGRLPWASGDTALPMWYVDGAAVDGDGMIYCPSPPWGRIQLYDRDKRFVRGWSVNASGGTFRIHVNRDNHLEVATARGRMLYVFDREGHLLSGASYEPRSYSVFDGWRGRAIVIPTPFYLIPLTHPLLAWALALAGMLIMMAASRPRRPARPDAVYRLLRRKI